MQSMVVLWSWISRIGPAFTPALQPGVIVYLKHIWNLVRRETYGFAARQWIITISQGHAL
jgi:hypothetical protein